MGLSLIEANHQATSPCRLGIFSHVKRISARRRVNFQDYLVRILHVVTIVALPFYEVYVNFFFLILLFFTILCMLVFDVAG